MKKITHYFKPATIQEAVKLFHQYPGKSRYIAGGTKVAAQRDSSVERLIDITCCGLNRIVEEDGELRIGACVTLEALRQSPLLKDFAGGILPDVAKWTGSVQLRNSSTIGGNLIAKGDIALVLMALDARLLVVQDTEKIVAMPDFNTGDGVEMEEGALTREIRLIPLSEFYAEHCGSLPEGELIEEIRIPSRFRHAKAAALRMSRTRQDVSMAAMAVAAFVDNGKCQTARIAASPVACGIRRLVEAEKLVEREPLTQERIEQVAAQIAQTVDAIEDFRATAAFRRHLLSIYAKRALSRLCE